MTKKLLSVLLALSMILSLSAVCASAAPAEDFEIVGEWIHGSTIADYVNMGEDVAPEDEVTPEEAVDIVIDRCSKMGTTDLYLLVKGTGGTLGYNKTQYTEAITRTTFDVLELTIAAAHDVGIRVHAWLCCGQDALYKANNPDAGLWHYVRERDNNNIFLGDADYQQYMMNIATEIASQYAVDGIHFDYIRYNHLTNGWSEADFAALEAMGGDVENIKYLINKTFYSDKLPEGDSVDSQYIFNEYRNGNEDALLIAEYRRGVVTGFAEKVFAAATAEDPDLVLSGAIMPEGGVAMGTNNSDVAFADLHYGQNYEDCAELYTYICPMAYCSDYGQGAEWFANIAKYAVEVGNEVVMGTQAYYPAKSADLMAAVNAVRGMEGVKGIIHFRHSQFGYIRLTEAFKAGLMTAEVINTNATGYPWVIIEMPEGVKAVGGLVVFGFADETPITVAEDGSSITFGYDPAEVSDMALPGLGEGGLIIFTEGMPTNDDGIHGLGRIYITNESRSYNIYDSLGYTGYDDVPDTAWYSAPVGQATLLGLMNGVGNNLFQPNGVTTRAMAMTTLWRMVGCPEADLSSANPFTDVPADQWYSEAVIWAYQEGITTGTTETTFEPDAPVTREQLVTFLFRMLGVVDPEATLEGFTDAGSVSEYAVPAMTWAVANGVINGRTDTTLVPQGICTRAELAAMLSRLVFSMMRDFM